MDTVFLEGLNKYFNDVSVCRCNGKTYIYYQSDERRIFQDGEGKSVWELAVTADGKNFISYNSVLAEPKNPSQSVSAYGLCVAYINREFYAVYTVREDGTRKEIVRIAKSGDGVCWEKLHEICLEAPEGYEKSCYRYPFITYDKKEGKYILLVSGRKKDNKKENDKKEGTIIYYMGSALTHMNFMGTLYTPGGSGDIVSPGIYYKDNKWFLLYANESGGWKTQCRILGDDGKTWKNVRHRFIDGRCFEHVRGYESGGRMYLYGIVSLRSSDSDLAQWSKKGSLILREVRSIDEDGISCIPYGDFAVSHEEVPIKREFRISREGGREEYTICSNTGTVWFLECNIEFESGTRGFGVQICSNEGLDEGYAYPFSVAINTVRFDQCPHFKWFTYQNKDIYQTLELVPDRKYELKLMVDKDISILYIDGKCLSARMKKRMGEGLKFYVDDGALKISEICLKVAK